eukprot:TRINITY_DN16696_c0_g2_i2.p1 TRINITY_DN16696_c0_g2~~TRINITY_DN16696_c0_g2_i2.p1  ORF type:complete len:688 (-),score=206.17 TRINITY_DN16696_c0_g2_i2:44-2107(-)
MASQSQGQTEGGPTQSSTQSAGNPADTFKILIVTDTHIGYQERDPIRGDDSFSTWEEVLHIAKSQQVDFILHGGDLFHDNKPSRRTLYRTMEAIRKYCFGDQQVAIQVVSDQAQNFPNFKTVNYQDPNFNISIPIFVIHGNHDDPSGDGQYSALDLLSVCNFVNYFGKSSSIDDITVYPILMTKGMSKLALYGIGNIRDERLFRTFQQKKVKLKRPVENREEWFSMMVLHQNRVAHSPKNYIHEAFFESFLNFILWGHEHECNIQPQMASQANFYISQPGSTVATSLSEFESKPKHVGILEIQAEKFRLTPIPLNTVRPYLIEDIVLASVQISNPTDNEEITQALTEKVEEMIEKARIQQKELGRPDLKPLIRLKVDYTGYSTISVPRFGQQFVGKVANPKDILLFHRRKNTKSGVRPGVENPEAEEELFVRGVRPDPVDSTKIEDLILSFLGPTGSGSVEILPEGEFTNALHQFVDKEDKGALSDFIQKKLKTTQTYLEKQDPTKTKTPDEISHLVMEQMIKQNTLDNLKKQEAIQKAKEEENKEMEEEESGDKSPKTKKQKDEVKETIKVKSEPSQTRKRPHQEVITLDEDEDELLMPPPSKKAKKPKLTAAKSKPAPAPAPTPAPAPSTKALKTEKEKPATSKSSQSDSKKSILAMLQEDEDSEMPDEQENSSFKKRWGKKKAE